MQRRRRDRHLKTLCQVSSWAGFDYKPSINSQSIDQSETKDSSAGLIEIRL